MYITVLLFAVCLIAAVNAKRDEECLKLLDRATVKCCKKLFRLKSIETSEQDRQSCLQEQKKTPPSNDFKICVANKRGYATLDGNLNKKPYETMIEKIFEEYPELVVNIKEMCINGDLSEFGPDETSELVKSEYCMIVQIALQCPEWDNSGSCKDTEDLLNKCAKA